MPHGDWSTCQGELTPLGMTSWEDECHMSDGDSATCRAKWKVHDESGGRDERWVIDLDPELISTVDRG